MTCCKDFGPPVEQASATTFLQFVFTSLYNFPSTFLAGVALCAVPVLARIAFKASAPAMRRCSLAASSCVFPGVNRLLPDGTALDTEEALTLSSVFLVLVATLSIS